jgi:hypothetical protein
MNITNFFWQLFCAMDLDITNQLKAEAGSLTVCDEPDYFELLDLQMLLDQCWYRMEDEIYG